MKLRSKRIALDLVEPGMELAAAVHDRRGEVLLYAGCELSVSALDGLRKRGIGRIAVRVVDVRDEDELAAERTKVLTRLNLLFRNAEQDGQLALLYRLVLGYKTGELS